MKHTIILISLFSFAPGQTIHHKCGIIPEHEPALQRESHNWGYGYDSLFNLQKEYQQFDWQYHLDCPNFDWSR